MKQENNSVILDGIMRDMSEGVLVVGFDGIIGYLNPAALDILGMSEEKLLGRNFGTCFFDRAENDDFTQAVLDAIYDRTRAHEAIVHYDTGGTVRQLHMVTSFLTDEGKSVGVIVVLSDMTELAELRDAVKAMERIRALNAQLELRNKLLSETFGRFLSDEIVRQLLDTPDGLALGGKKRTLSVMMSDLRGFTAMCEHMNAGDLVTMLNHYLAEMTEIIERRGGTIIEFLGDGIMAIFGAPALSETHAADAVATAVEMQARLEQVNEWNAERDYPQLEMGVGINTGEVIVGNIGSERRMKYGVIGSNVNLCGRIESYTVGGQVLISPCTRESCGVELEIAQEMTVYPKGVEGALVLSQVTGVGAPYNVTERVASMKPKALKEPIPVAFCRLLGKHGGTKTRFGGIVAAARGGAVLDTQCELEIYDNIQIEAGGELFAKVMEKTDKGYLLRYTSIPAGYEAWLKDKTGGRKP